jgi:hypothetical protein
MRKPLANQDLSSMTRSGGKSPSFLNALTPAEGAVVANKRSVEQVASMNEEPPPGCCEICGAKIPANGVVCAECENAFEQGRADEVISEDATLDLAKYSAGMFPWEPSSNRLRLITNSRHLVAVVLALVILIALLALLRTPFPSCWEISS